jgi:hypothetical protein
VTIVTTLSRRRAHAFTVVVARLLRRAEAAGSPLLAADAKSVRTLKEAGEHAEGLRREVRSARRIAGSATTATLRAVDAVPAYTIVDARGRVVRRARARASEAFIVTLRRSTGGWRLASVRLAPDGR